MFNLSKNRVLAGKCNLRIHPTLLPALSPTLAAWKSLLGSSSGVVRGRLWGVFPTTPSATAAACSEHSLDRESGWSWTGDSHDKIYGS